MKSHKKIILIHYIGYMAIKDLKYEKINSVNISCFVFNKVDKYLEYINKSKYLTLVTTNERKEKIKIYEHCGAESEI